MIKQLNTIALIIATVWATPAFATTYNVVEDISGTFTQFDYGINKYLSNYSYVLANLVSGDASLFSASLTSIDNGAIDLVTGDSSCSGLCSNVETLLNGDKIFSTFTYNANFDGVATVTFSA